MLSKNNLPITVLVSDGMWRKSLSAIRSLGKSGYKVIVLGDWAATTGFWSRYTSRRWILPDANVNPKKFGLTLIRKLQKINQPDSSVLLCMEDATVQWVVKNIDKVTPLTNVLVPSAESLRIASSKSETIKWAQNLGLPTPETLHPGDVSEFKEYLRKIPTNKLNSWVVKPITGSGSMGLVYLTEKSKIDWNKHWQVYGPCIIQKRILQEGSTRGVSILFDRQSRVISKFTHERIREYPRSGGPSTLRVSVRDHNLEAYSVKLLKSLDWCGVAMVEWKRDPLTRQWFLLEINPRFWGSLELAIRAGINFPTLYVKAALGELIKEENEPIEGVICRWTIPGDLLRFLSSPKSEREPLKIFFKDIRTQSEEWDPLDKKGFFSSLFCQAIAIFRPKYWKFIRK